jgi:hypothetical protein
MKGSLGVGHPAVTDPKSLHGISARQKAGTPHDLPRSSRDLGSDSSPLDHRQPGFRRRVRTAGSGSALFGAARRRSGSPHRVKTRPSQVRSRAPRQLTRPPGKPTPVGSAVRSTAVTLITAGSRHRCTDRNGGVEQIASRRPNLNHSEVSIPTEQTIGPAGGGGP